MDLLYFAYNNILVLWRILYILFGESEHILAPAAGLAEGHRASSQNLLVFHRTYYAANPKDMDPIMQCTEHTQKAPLLGARYDAIPNTLIIVNYQVKLKIKNPPPTSLKVLRTPNTPNAQTTIGILPYQNKHSTKPETTLLFKSSRPYLNPKSETIRQ